VADKLINKKAVEDLARKGDRIGAMMEYTGSPLGRQKRGQT
jgi:hypothetical protein